MVPERLPLVPAVHGHDRRHWVGHRRPSSRRSSRCGTTPPRGTLQPLTPITRFVQHSLTNTEHTYDVTRHLVSGWVQDDWRDGRPADMNLGMRWDWDSNGNNERLEFRPWLSGNASRANYNFAPRIGMNLQPR